MKNKLIKVIVLAIILIGGNIFIHTVNAGYKGIDTNITIGNTIAIGSSEEVTNRIVGTLQVAGTIISIIALIIIGIRYMISSVEEKAQLKGILIYWVIGAVLVFATSNILGFVYSIINGINNSEGINNIPICATHSWNNGETISSATCTSTGLKKYTCTVCKRTKTEIVPKTEHDEDNIETYYEYSDNGWHNVYHKYSCCNTYKTDDVITAEKCTKETWEFWETCEKCGN